MPEESLPPIQVTATGEVVATHAATVDLGGIVLPKEILIDVEVIRADGTVEPVETIKGELVWPSSK